MTTNEIVGCVTMIVAIIGLIFSCYQWWKKVQLERAERLSKLITLLRKDVRQLNILYQIDYGNFRYDNNFHNGKSEGEMDQLLSFYEYILYLKMEHIISKKEFSFFEYDINSIVDNHDIQTYLFNLYHFSEPENSPFAKSSKKQFVYKNLLNYAKKRKCIDSSFEKNINAYPRHLFLNCSQNTR